MASRNKTRTSTRQLFSPVAIDGMIKKIDKQIMHGERLIKNRPITRDSFESWETATYKILKKAEPIDPLAPNRFLECGIYWDNGSNPDGNVHETQYAMTVYDKIRILDYHLGMLKREKKYIN